LVGKGTIVKNIKIIKTFNVLALAILLSCFAGCTTATTSVRAPTVGYSGFDNARTVSIVPHGTALNSMMDVATTSIGAQWSASHVDQVTLVIEVYGASYTAVTGAELNIDGEKIALTPAGYATDMEPSGIAGFMTSTKSFLTDLDTVEKIIKSKRTWLRVQTPTGTLENMVADGAKNSKAYYALIKFMDAVKTK
jgi:hypothetical protein